MKIFKLLISSLLISSCVAGEPRISADIVYLRDKISHNPWYLDSLEEPEKSKYFEVINLFGGEERISDILIQATSACRLDLETCISDKGELPTSVLYLYEKNNNFIMISSFTSPERTILYTKGLSGKIITIYDSYETSNTCEIFNKAPLRFVGEAKVTNLDPLSILMKDIGNLRSEPILRFRLIYDKNGCRITRFG